MGQELLANLLITENRKYKFQDLTSQYPLSHTLLWGKENREMFYRMSSGPQVVSNWQSFSSFILGTAFYIITTYYVK